MQGSMLPLNSSLHDLRAVAVPLVVMHVHCIAPSNNRRILITWSIDTFQVDTVIRDIPG
jgi:hypothetical protein